MKANIRSLLAAFSAIGIAATITGCQSPETKSQSAAPSSATPCMDVLGLFTAADVPAMGPAEIAVKDRKPITNAPPTDLPGNGLAQHPMLYVGEGYNKMFLING